MSFPSTQRSAETSFELRFEALFTAGRGYAFPCDAEGKVDPGRLTEQAHRNYLRAWAAVGREFLYPVLCCIHRGMAASR